MITVRDLLSIHLEDTFARERWHPTLDAAVWGLTADQAAWKPSLERHSIWQIVRHLTHWKRGVLQALTGDAPDFERMTREDWVEVAGDQAAWEADVRALHDIYAEFRQRLEVLGDEGLQRAVRSYRQSAEPVVIARRLLGVFTHDAYHSGQIQYLRALQGIPADRFFNAAWDGNVPRLREILEGHSDLTNAYNREGWTALQIAAYTGQPEAVQFLLGKGADLRLPSRNEMANTALHGAVAGWRAGYRAATVEVLLERGADLEAQDAGGNTALHLAAHEDATDVIELLLRHGSSVNARRGDGKTPLGAAVGEGKTGAADALRRAGGIE